MLGLKLNHVSKRGHSYHGIKHDGTCSVTATNVEHKSHLELKKRCLSPIVPCESEIGDDYCQIYRKKNEQDCVLFKYNMAGFWAQLWQK